MRAQHNIMGGLFSTNEDILREKRVDARRQLYHLDRMILKQKEQLLKIEATAASSKSDAELSVVVSDGLLRLEKLRMVIHTRLNEIEILKVSNGDNMIQEEIHKMSEEIRKAAAPIPNVDAGRVQEAQVGSLTSRFERLRAEGIVAAESSQLESMIRET